MNTDDRYPVVTLVLYFGYEKHWDKPLNLLGRVNVPEKFRPYVNDYRVNLFEVAYLTDEQLDWFQSDFRIVADYFVQMRKNKDYQPEPRKMWHVQETLQLLSVMTHDNRYEMAYNESGEGGLENMCEVLDRIENGGIAIGEARGEARGEASILTLMQKLFAAGRVADAERASNDRAYCSQLLAEYGLAK